MRQQQTATPNHQLEEARLERLLTYERAAIAQGYQSIAGLDEAGRGCLAGPVVAGACLLPIGLKIPGVNDSKQLSAEKRDSLYEILINHPDIHTAVGIVEPEEIDRINIFQATIVAMLRAVDGLKISPDYLLVDGLKLPHQTLPCLKIIKGDTLSMSIAAASIIAKVTRDRLMIDEYHQKYPQYAFNQHKGYSTARHLEALNQHGPCPIHRRSYEPVRVLCQPVVQSEFAFLSPI